MDLEELEAVSVVVKISFPVEARLTGTAFTAYGMLVPSDWTGLRASLQGPGVYVQGSAAPTLTPYEWAFRFEDLPSFQPLKLVVEAIDDDDDVVGADCTGLLMIPGLPNTTAGPDFEDLSIRIGTPSDPNIPSRLFSAAGWMNGVKSVSAQIDRDNGATVLAAGTSTTASLLFDWALSFDIPASVPAGAARLFVWSGPINNPTISASETINIPA